MIFSKEKQLCFFTPPKNGTHTLTKFLSNFNWHTIKPLTHTYPEVLIKKYPNLLNYKTFVFLRNPLDRFESFVLFVKQKRTDDFEKLLNQNGIDQSVEKTSYEDLIGLFDKFPENWKVLHAPQSNWITLPTTEVLDFDNFESELHRVTGLTGPIPWENQTTDWGKSVITDKVCAFVREYYAADYALAKDRLGKTYGGVA